MGDFIKPKAFLIAETKVNYGSMEDALNELGLTNWDTDGNTDAAILTEFAGKSCYLSFDKCLNKNLTKTGGRTNEEYIMQGILGNGHGSVLEHSTSSFFLTNVSRVVTHEAVRHRAGTAFSQTSGRYVRTDEIDMYLPEEIKEYPAAVKLFEQGIAQQEALLAELAEITGINGMTDFNKKKRLTSAFRRLIGNGQANHILITANHRAWRHMIEMRTSEHAEEEIRFIFGDIARQLQAREPVIYGDMTSREVNGLPEYIFANSKV